MQKHEHTALPHHMPPEGLRILRAESEAEIERAFADLAREGFVPAQRLEVRAEWDEDSREWRTLYVLALWKMGNDDANHEGEEMFV